MNWTIDINIQIVENWINNIYQSPKPPLTIIRPKIRINMNKKLNKIGEIKKMISSVFLLVKIVKIVIIIAKIDR